MRRAKEGVDEDDLLKFDSVCNENALRFRKTKTVEIMMAIDPDIAPGEAESSEDDKSSPEDHQIGISTISIYSSPMLKRLPALAPSLHQPKLEN